MAAQFSNKADNMLSSLAKTFDLALKYGGGEFRDLETYSTMAKDICLADVRNEKVIKAINDSQDKDTTAHFEENYNNNLARQDKRHNNPKRLHAFQKQLQEILDASEASTTQNRNRDGDVMFEDFVSNIDPITKKPMVNPVKNKKCGHHYEKESILASIAINPHLRCPVVGCVNKSHITQSALVDDPVFAKILREISKEESD